MKKASLIAIVCLTTLTTVSLCAQQLDAAFGVGTLTAPSGVSAAGNHAPVTMGGGAYPAFSADYIFKHNFGFGGEVAWRASRNSYLGVQPYRPILYDFYGLWGPKLGKHTQAVLMGGIGAETIRFYVPYYSFSAVSGFTNFTSSTHFLGQFGGALRVYPWRHLFIGPEAHLYLIHNNEEFSSGRAARFGVSIGYTMTSEQH